MLASHASFWLLGAEVSTVNVNVVDDPLVKYKDPEPLLHILGPHGPP